MDSNDPIQVQVFSTENDALRTQIHRKLELQDLGGGKLGELEHLAIQCGLIFNTSNPSITNPCLLLYASDHGIIDAGLNPLSSNSTAKHVLDCLQGEGVINHFCNSAGLSLKLIDVGVNHSFEGTVDYWLNHGSKVLSRKIDLGTSNFAERPAMTTKMAYKAIESGQKIVENEYSRGTNTIGIGGMAIGGYWSCLTVICALYDTLPKHLINPRIKIAGFADPDPIEVISKALKRNPKSHDPLMILSMYGGFEIAAMMGSILKAAELRMLVIVDGVAGLTALALASAMVADVKEYCIVTNCSGFTQQAICDKLKMRPILNLGMLSVAGSGVALALPIIQSTLTFLNNEQ